MPLTKKYVAIIVASTVGACLVIAGIVVTIVLVTKKHKDTSDETTRTSSTTPTQTPLPDTTTTTTAPPNIYYNETLIIAFNIGYQNDDSSFDDLQNSLNELIDQLNFNGSLLIQLLPYTDKLGGISEKFNNPQSIIDKINETLSNPENITGRNPSQTNAITALQTNNFTSNGHRRMNFAAEMSETKYCFYSPPKAAYADPGAIASDSKQSGILISNITSSAKNFALILMPEISINDYNIAANQKFITTTYDNVTVAVEFLDPDQFLITTTTTTITTPAVNATIYTQVIGGGTTTTVPSNVTNGITPSTTTNNHNTTTTTTTVAPTTIITHTTVKENKTTTTSESITTAET